MRSIVAPKQSDLRVKTAIPNRNRLQAVFSPDANRSFLAEGHAHAGSIGKNSNVLDASAQQRLNDDGLSEGCAECVCSEECALPWVCGDNFQRCEEVHSTYASLLRPGRGILLFNPRQRNALESMVHGRLL
jgi:hypothetical protein